MEDLANTEVLADNIGNQADAGSPPPAPEKLPDDIGNKADEGAEPEWKPNLKVKAYDKEFEIPEKFHSLITKENEKEFRDIHEKAFALDVMKEKNAKIREQNEQYQTRIEKEYMPVVQTYQKMDKFLKNDDLDSFFANIPALTVEKIGKWALHRLSLKDLPEDQQALYNEARAAREKAYQLEEENASYKQKDEQLSQAQKQAAVDHIHTELDKVVARPEFSEFVKQFDSRLGQDGAFKLEALRRAVLISRQEKRDVSVEEAVTSFMQVLGQSGQTPPAQDPANPQPKAAPKPTLPSLTGKSTSPVSQKVKSLDDLKKLSRDSIAAASRQSRE